ncbi:protein canopy homolog 3-like [Stegodyphus dumicola]|uniref:protein canopy homolog 3-like n=1 Tax=Stegodyphus dumicola TaxID=202533 RepID=UPI0015B2BAC6|nr:protein canopy homolog 3-like [Stegodyphus dumicola]
MNILYNFSTFLLYFLHTCQSTFGNDDDDHSPEEELYGVKYAGDCEVCKYLVIELESRLSETGKTHDVIEIGYELDPAARKKKKYAHSELRLVESLDGICERLLDYNIHKERKDSTRFAKGMSTTFKVLHDLV